ncbi:MAG: 4'-phosphopantetheinyl transferase superfamily protein [Candidatus Omnitrophota bacterium]|nr:4'-phosphopantetheinyl transferase superfamily protein [Candidatus Omnitrophota bacterium]
MTIRGIGIDLITYSKARKFLSTHGREKANRLLTASEKKTWAAKSFSERHFSCLLAAKEACFKAQNRAWMGTQGFSDIEVNTGSRGEFQVSARNSGKGPVCRGWGSFFSNDKYVGAQVILWDNTPECG